MASVPLHPALVHIPLALAVLVPFGAALTAWLIARRRTGSGAWAAVVAAQAVLFAGGLAAQRTGSADEERIEDRVRESAIERHEEAAEAFVVAAGVVLLVSAAGLVGPSAARRWTMLAATAGTVAVATLGVRTGKAGGELVYVHGAAGSAADVASSGRGDAAEEGERPKERAGVPGDTTGASRGADRGRDSDRDGNRAADDDDDRRRGGR